MTAGLEPLAAPRRAVTAPNPPVFIPVSDDDVEMQMFKGGRGDKKGDTLSK